MFVSSQWASSPSSHATPQTHKELTETTPQLICWPVSAIYSVAKAMQRTDRLCNWGPLPRSKEFLPLLWHSAASVRTRSQIMEFMHCLDLWKWTRALRS